MVTGMKPMAASCQWTLILWAIICLFFVICRNIFKNDRFPPETKIVGYARSALTVDALKEKCKPYMKVCVQRSVAGAHREVDYHRMTVVITIGQLCILLQLPIYTYVKDIDEF